MIPNVLEIFSTSFVDSDGKYANTISDRDVQLLFDHKLFKCFLSKELNGLGLSIQETLQVIEKAAYVNGSLGWLVQIGNGGNYFASNFDSEVSIELFSKSDAVIAGSGAPITACKRVEGGVVVSGIWKFCSGSDFATLFTITFKDEHSDDVLSGIIDRSEVVIHKDWKTIGMKNTSTNSIEVHDVFIADKHLFSVGTQRSFSDEKVFNFPFIIYAQSFFIQVVFGIFKRLLDETDVIVKKSENLNSVSQISRFKKLQALKDEGERLLKTAKSSCEEMVAFIDKSPEITPLEGVKFQECYIFNCNKIREHALIMYVQHGIDAIYEDNLINVLFNDILVVCQHKIMNEVVD
jgi:indole-3-acetate monooxygenase